MTFTLPEHFLVDLVATFAFGLITIVLMMIGYKVFDKLTPKTSFEDCLNNNNIAVAVVVAGLFIAVAIVIASVIRGVLG